MTWGETFNRFAYFTRPRMSFYRPGLNTRWDGPWGRLVTPQIPRFMLVVKPVTEKEGFEPSFAAKEGG